MRPLGQTCVSQNVGPRKMDVLRVWFLFQSPEKDTSTQKAAFMALPGRLPGAVPVRAPRAAAGGDANCLRGRRAVAAPWHEGARWPGFLMSFPGAFPRSAFGPA